MNSTPDSGEVDETVEAVDPALLDARDVALAALGEITSPASIGEPAGYRLEDDGVVSLKFENLLAGYPGWFWTVSVARVEGEEPTVLETELLPGDGALLAPDWVPWAVRLAEYQATQAALAAEAAEHASDGEDDADDADDLDETDEDDLDDLDAADFDEDGSPILHAGDLDGVDIDELDDIDPDDAAQTAAEVSDSDEDDDDDFDEDEDEDGFDDEDDSDDED